jgi:hypothetical protein
MFKDEFSRINHDAKHLTISIQTIQRLVFNFGNINGEIQGLDNTSITIPTIGTGYLYDVDWNNDSASADHHLNEFLIIQPYIGPGTVVAIDDNSRWVNNNRRTGKGRAIVEYLETQGHLPILDEYQLIFQF